MTDIHVVEMCGFIGFNITVMTWLKHLTSARCFCHTSGCYINNNNKNKLVVKELHEVGCGVNFHSWIKGCEAGREEEDASSMGRAVLHSGP